MNITTIPIDRIEVGDRLRVVDEDYAQLIAASMAVDGQRTPIEVRAPNQAEVYPLIAGAHRYRAARIAGLPTLDARVLDVSDLDARRLEIEENLCRHELSELDRSTFLARWKEVYEAIHNAKRHGGKRRGVQVAKVGDLNDTLGRFTAIAAERLGLSERVIQRATNRFRHIAPDVRERIAGTWLASNGSELDLLARMTPAVQRKVVDLMQSRGATRLSHLRDEVQGIRMPTPDADQAQFDALIKLWRKTGAKARRQFLAELDKDRQFDLGETS